MNRKIHSSHPYHSVNHKGFRSSVPGTWDKDKIHISYITISHIYLLYILKQNLKYLKQNICSHSRYFHEIHHFIVFLVIIYYEVILFGNIPVGFPERIYFCLYGMPGGTKVITFIVFSSGVFLCHSVKFWVLTMFANLFTNSQKRLVFFFLSHPQLT